MVLIKEEQDNKQAFKWMDLYMSATYVQTKVLPQQYYPKYYTYSQGQLSEEMSDVRCFIHKRSWIFIKLKQFIDFD